MNDNIKGLFETSHSIGLIYAVMEDKDGKFQYTPIPCFNDCRGENTALETMTDPMFRGWAIDPWTSKINITIT